MQGDPLARSGRRYTRPESRNGLQDESRTLNLLRGAGHAPADRSFAQDRARQHNNTEQFMSNGVNHAAGAAGVAGQSEADLTRYYARDFGSLVGSGEVPRTASSLPFYRDAKDDGYGSRKNPRNKVDVQAQNPMKLPSAHEPSVCVISPNGQPAMPDAGHAWWDQQQTHLNPPANLAHMYQNQQLQCPTATNQTGQHTKIQMGSYNPNVPTPYLNTQTGLTQYAPSQTVAPTAVPNAPFMQHLQQQQQTQPQSIQPQEPQQPIASYANVSTSSST